MPDTMGLRTAYKAYKRRETINGKSEAALPGLEMFNNDQIFFLSSANVRISIKIKFFHKIDFYNFNNRNISLFILSYLSCFFFSFLQLWCENRDSETAITEAKLDVHSIARLRSIGALSNNQNFADAFSCPIGSPMNRKKKCNIWKI